MTTQIIKIHPEFPEREKIAHCAKVIRQGGLVVFPTETVYGIAVDANNPKAMARLREVKKRSEDKPFSMMIAQKESLMNYSKVRDPKVFRLVDRYWPGPLTIILPRANEEEAIGLRMPDHVVALCLVQEAQTIIAAPSANFEGNPPPITCEEALKDLDGLVDVALDAGSADLGKASTIVDFTQDKPIAIREGAISQTDVDQTVDKKTILMVCTGNSCRSVIAEYLMRDKLKNQSDIHIESAGTSVFLTAAASAGAATVLHRRGIDASRHRSQPLTSILLQKSDLILVMTRRHRDAVVQFAPEVAERTYLLKEFVPELVGSPDDVDISDPMGMTDIEYEQCARVIDAALDKVVATL